MARSNKPGDAPGVADAIESIEHEAFSAATSPEEAPVTKRASNKESAEEKPGGFLVYIGPSILGVIQSGSIFAGDNDATVAAAVQKFPLVKALLVPGDRLAADRIKVKTPGNSLYENYRKLVATAKTN